MSEPQMTNQQRAAQIWAVLVMAARTQQVLSYRIVGRLTGLPQHGVSQPLGPIMRYCIKHNMPPLTSIVINEQSGLPGDGLWEAESPTEMFKAQARVFVFDWFKEDAPKPSDFEQFLD